MEALETFISCVFSWRSSAARSTQGAKFNLEQNKIFRLMESILFISYRLSFKQWQVKTDFRKAVFEDGKRTI